MNEVGYARLAAVAALIAVWFGGCTVIRDISTEEVINPYTGQTEHVQKQYLTWERNMGKFIFVSMLAISGALWKIID